MIPVNSMLELFINLNKCIKIINYQNSRVLAPTFTILTNNAKKIRPTQPMFTPSDLGYNLHRNVKYMMYIATF